MHVSERDSKCQCISHLARLATRTAAAVTRTSRRSPYYYYFGSRGAGSGGTAAVTVAVMVRHCGHVTYYAIVLDGRLL